MVALPHLLVDGVKVSPVAIDNRILFFLFPARVADTCLVSPSFQAGGRDTRRLGVIVDSLAISDGTRWRTIALNDPGLYAGFHAIEHQGPKTWRWTVGQAHLSPKLWDGLTDVVLLRVVGVFTGLDRR